MYNQEFFNRIQISELILQLMTLIWASEDVSNNKLMEELQRQNKEYLEKIIEQNNQILEEIAGIKG